ncbi:SDR family oxidoreductase [Candidatus Woesearchaeota archaeon]|nr:SDR family oxidoreductase [Candidatus Woesearchaeota archaeon]
MENKKTVLITGSSKGLGKELALIFAKNDFNLIIHGRNQNDLKQVKKQILKNDVSCNLVVGDLKDLETIDDLYKLAIKKNISILINNAALATNFLFEELTDEEIDYVNSINLIAPLKLARRIYSFFIKKKEGFIININSVSGVNAQPERGVLYSATKFALRGFTNALRQEIKKSNNNIKVLGVYLAGMKTTFVKRTEVQIDFQNCMEPQEVAEIIFDLTKNYKSVNIEDIVLGKLK